MIFICAIGEVDLAASCVPLAQVDIVQNCSRLLQLVVSADVLSVVLTMQEKAPRSDRPRERSTAVCTPT